MKLLASEPAPQWTPNWTAFALDRIKEEYDRDVELLNWAYDTFDEATASEIVSRSRVTAEPRARLLSAALQEIAFYRWAAATAYYQCKGRHLEEDAQAPRDTSAKHGEIIDFAEFLRSREFAER